MSSHSCEEIRSQLALRECGALEPDEASRVESHLAHCASCRAEAAALRTSRQGLDRWEVPQDSEDPRSAARLVMERERRGTLRRRRRAFVAVAAASLLALLALGEWRTRAAVAGIDREIETRARAIAAELFDARAAELGRAGEERIAALERACQRDRDALLVAFENARAADREDFQTALAGIARASALETRETREALLDLVAYAARRESP